MSFEHELFQRLVREVEDYAIFMVDPQGCVENWNPGAERLFGYRADEIVGRSHSVFFTAEEIQVGAPESDRRNALVAGDVVRDRWQVRKDRSRFWSSERLSPLREEEDAIRGFAVMVRDLTDLSPDVTDQRRTEAAAQQSEAREAGILETALDCIIMMDHRGRVVEFNPAAEKTFGYSRAGAIGQELAELVVPPSLRERHRRGLARYLATGEGSILNRRVEISAMRADGTEFPVELSITRILTPGPPLFTAYLRDITERTNLEARRGARLAVTQIVANAETAQEAAAGVLREVCERLGWDVGFYWTLDRKGKTLRCLESWRRPGAPGEEIEAASQRRGFERGAGLPGCVWESGKSIWIRDLVENENFPRIAQAVDDGLRGAFGCPVVVGGETSGVIELFSRRIQEPDAELLEMVETVAGQIGQLVERRHAEAAVRESEEKLHLLVDTIPQLAWMANPDGYVFWYNRRWYQYTGAAPEQMEGWGWQSVHDPEALPEVMERWTASIRSGEPFDMVFPIKGADGIFRPFLTRINPLRDETGRIVYWFGTNTDISEQKRAEDTSRFLAEASATLVAVVDYESTLTKVARLSVPFFADWCAVDIVEHDGSLRRLTLIHENPSRVAHANALADRYPLRPDDRHGPFQVLRTRQSEMISPMTDEILVASARDEDHLRGLRELNVRSYISTPIVTRGTPVGVLTFATSDSGRQYGAADLALARDLADRAAVAIDNAQLYSELKEADRLKDVFLATLAHELRNPLAPIRSALKVMQQPGASEEMVQRARNIAERQAQHMSRLLDDLLDVSRFSQGRIELHKAAVDVAALINNAVEAARPVIEDRRHELTVSVPKDPLHVAADPTRLEQVLINLLNNAAKYTDPGGRIWLTAESDGGEIVFRVRDTGIGIAPEMLPHIFDVFVQAERRLDRSRGGIGIGLTLVRRLVELHGGTVTARSAGTGQGSEFIVRLPAATVGASRNEMNGSAAETPRVSPRRVLVVDDNPDAADGLAMVLELLGHDARVAYDGSAAMAQVREFQPAIVFLDIGMPGMDGYEVARRLRQQPGLDNTFLVALTGWGQKEDRRRSHEAGFDHHLVKPVEPDELNELLADLLNRRQS